MYPYTSNVSMSRLNQVEACKWREKYKTPIPLQIVPTPGVSSWDTPEYERKRLLDANPELRDLHNWGKFQNKIAGYEAVRQANRPPKSEAFRADALARGREFVARESAKIDAERKRADTDFVALLHARASNYTRRVAEEQNARDQRELDVQKTKLRDAMLQHGLVYNPDPLPARSSTSASVSRRSQILPEPTTAPAFRVFGEQDAAISPLTRQMQRLGVSSDVDDMSDNESPAAVSSRQHFIPQVRIRSPKHWSPMEDAPTADNVLNTYRVVTPAASSPLVVQASKPVAPPSTPPIAKPQTASDFANFFSSKPSTVPTTASPAVRKPVAVLPTPASSPLAKPVAQPFITAQTGNLVCSFSPAIAKPKTAIDYADFFSDKPSTVPTAASPAVRKPVAVLPAPATVAAKSVSAAPINPALYYPVQLLDAGGGGNCFFFSLYEAAKNTGVLGKITTQFPAVDTSSKERFNETFRTALATYITTHNFAKQYDGFLSLTDQAIDKDDWMEQLKDMFPDWYVKAFPFSTKPLDPEYFKTQIAQGVSQPGNYVGDIEVSAARNMLDECGIWIQSFSKMPTTMNLRRVFNGKSLLNLYNQSEMHWQYFAFLQDGVGVAKGDVGSAGIDRNLSGREVPALAHKTPTAAISVASTSTSRPQKLSTASEAFFSNLTPVFSAKSTLPARPVFVPGSLFIKH